MKNLLNILIKKRIIAITLVLMVLCATNVFAYRWIKDKEKWFVYDDKEGHLIINSLIDVGDNVYYFGEDGVMCTGWHQNKDTGDWYFFDNNISGGNYGGMVFGLHTIDGYYRYFNDNGTLMKANAYGEYVKVLGVFNADYVGNLYFEGDLLIDKSEEKSNFWTKPEYYSNSEVNNKYIAEHDPPDYMYQFGTGGVSMYKSKDGNDIKVEKIEEKNDEVVYTSKIITTLASFGDDGKIQ